MKRGHKISFDFKQVQPEITFVSFRNTNQLKPSFKKSFDNRAEAMEYMKKSKKKNKGLVIKGVDARRREAQSDYQELNYTNLK